MPDMELSKSLMNTIQVAAIRAKLLFDTYQWKWDEGVPTTKEIVDDYVILAEEVWKQVIKVEDGKTVGYGLAKTGRLAAEYSDSHWEFSVELSSSFDGLDDEDNFVSSNLRRKLANVDQLGL